MKILILTEKPSVAKDIARTLGSFEKKSDHLVSDDFLITWAYGHLLELAEPEDYDKSFKFWTLQKLPIIPDNFTWKPIKKTEKHLQVIAGLIKKREVKEIINACDAGREGELIFRNIFEYSGSKKKHQRLWLSSMTNEAIQTAFQKLRPGDEFDALSHAAKCRSEADWIVGINATRAFTRRMGDLYSLGRVQTPTLAILVDREIEIRQFIPRTFFELKALLSQNKKRFEAYWYNPKAKEKDQRHEIPDITTAKAIQNKIEKQKALITESKTKETKEQHPLLFDLTDLQREANKRHGLTAAKTLAIAQSLYEDKKILTYPRTDSRYLPSDMKNELPAILKSLKNCDPYHDLAELSLHSNKVPGKRVIDDSKVSDHFAIIPTKQRPDLSKLSSWEQKIYDLVVRRFLSIFFDAAVYQECMLQIKVENECFESKEKILTQAGYRIVYGESPKTPLLASLIKNEALQVISSEIEEKSTKPRPRFTEASLLTAMQTAGKLIEEDDLKEAMKEKGIGTPATRAQIIERLIQVKYCERKGKDLFPTDKGMYLLQMLKSVPLPELSSPELTGIWEKKLLEIEKKSLQAEQFKKELSSFAKDMIDKIKKADFNAQQGGEVGQCPKCKAAVTERIRSYQCNQECGFKISKRILSGEISPDMARELLENGKTSQAIWFRSNQGKRFQAYLKLENDEIRFEFINHEEILNQEPCGCCPKCKSEVLEKARAFQCRNEECTFKISKNILGRIMKREEVIDLLKNKKTKKLNAFWSKKKKPFSAYLVLNEDGSIRFDFG